MQPLSGMQDLSSVAQNNRKTQLLVVIGALLLVLILVGATYFLFFKKHTTGTGQSTDAAKQSSSASSATDMATLKSVKLNLPASIDGYSVRATGVDSVKDYLSNDGVCEFIAGTVSASQLPGADLNAIVDPQLKALRDAGATVNGPNAGNALELKEAGGSKTYSMPTLNFEFAQDKKHAAVHYSAVILAGTDRAVINRTCINKDGAVDQSRLRALDDVAKKVTITVVP
jgi:hypothetical protein